MTLDIFGKREFVSADVTFVRMPDTLLAFMNVGPGVVSRERKGGQIAQSQKDILDLFA